MTATPDLARTHADEGGRGPLSLDRRRFVGWAIAGATVMAAADLSLAPSAHADGIPSGPQVPETFDLEDLQTRSAAPTSGLITVVVHPNGTASFALPRMEVGQGVTTSTAMIIAEELDISPDKVTVTLAPARPELVYNQLTGGSNTSVSTYTPIRVAASIAKGMLTAAAAAELGVAVERLRVSDGVVSAPDGRSLTYGELAGAGAAAQDQQVAVELKDPSQFTVLGRPLNRIDALEAVTGRKDFSMDLQVKGAKPTMICRAPQLNGTPRRLRNKRAITRMPGVTNVVMVDTGIAVRARTFGQCIDAIRAMKVDWNDGPAAGESDQTIMAELKREEDKNPLTVPDAGAGLQQVDGRFEFMFRSSASLEPGCAIADVRSDKARIWAGLKVPILAQQDIAAALGMTQDQVTVTVITGGGSFGHKLFSDAAIEAAKVSQKMKKPVKLMWHRADEPRQGRNHPMVTSRVRATIDPASKDIVSFEQRNTSVVTDFSHGLGEMLSSIASSDLPAGLSQLTLSQSIFTLTQELPYNFGEVTQLLNEVDERFNTGSMRNIYSPDTAVANELVIDQLAKEVGLDPLEFRLKFIKNDLVRAALEKVATEGDWGRTMPTGMAQGIAVHKEYKGATACLVEIDTRPQTVDRRIYNAVTGPRVTKVTFAVDAGLVLNPRGLEAQMIGGISDGIALTLTSSCHLKAGHFLEASWDNYFYTRQWNMPGEVDVHVMPSDADMPGGAGEAGVPATAAAVACAYARATGTVPTQFPINHGTISFKPKTFVPPVPPSPTNGLRYTY